MQALTEYEAAKIMHDGTIDGDTVSVEALASLKTAAVTKAHACLLRAFSKDGSVPSKTSLVAELRELRQYANQKEDSLLWPTLLKKVKATLSAK